MQLADGRWAATVTEWPAGQCDLASATGIDAMRFMDGPDRFDVDDGKRDATWVAPGRYRGMAKPERSARDLKSLTVQICQAVIDLTANRRGRAQQWVIASEVQQRAGLSDDDFEAAVAFAVESEALEANRRRGSLAVHRQHL